jgi:hypothetical protein
MPSLLELGIITVQFTIKMHLKLPRGDGIGICCLYPACDDMDVLGALRDAIAQQRPITYLEGSTPATALTPATTHIVLSPSLTVPRNAPTRFKKDAASSATDPESAPGEFFTVEALLLAWTLKNAGGGEYIRQTKTKGVAGSVGITARGRVVEWLEGKGEHPNVVGTRKHTYLTLVQFGLCCSRLDDSSLA